jgi:dCTP deaminase
MLDTRSATSDDLLGPDAPRTLMRGKSGVLPSQRIREMINRKMIRSVAEIEDGQIQPASLDLRLGGKAWRVRASFLPGRQRSVEQQLADLRFDLLNIEDGGVLERGCVYVVELQEVLHLPENISATANPKSSTGRLDIFTRLIVDGAEAFDKAPSGYAGKLYAEISPSSFSVRVRKGSRLNQLRFRMRSSSQTDLTPIVVSDKKLREWHMRAPLTDGEPVFRHGLLLSVDLAGTNESDVVGYRAQRFTDVVDVDRIGHYDSADFWEPLRATAARRLILDPHQFYILASRERVRIPADLAAEMVAIDTAIGEFRVHYAGFFDPGFGDTGAGLPGARGVLEVRSHEVPFMLEDGQFIGRLVFEPLSKRPEALYGEGGVSNYQGQGLKLSKHFR